MSSSEESKHDILLIITVALVILFITKLDSPNNSTFGRLGDPGLSD